MSPVLVLLLLLLILVPIAEISAIVFVGEQIGALPTVLLLLVSALIGSWLLRREGARAWRAVREASQAGRTPAREAVEGVLVLAGGLMMMLPGFFSDLLGLLLVLPPTRRVAARIVLGRIARRLPANVRSDLMGPVRVRSRRGKARTEPPPGGPPPPPLTPPGQGKVIEGEVEP
jgi:UPF0716 protein FxsA